MANIIIGTAGHVDHGKTQLIKALTGIDTDYHKEEKERGISIELGFAYLTLENGKRCGIIDVPGHEKFVGNMLAGAGSIDLALFVVAADEGIMPQSREHLEILSLLGIRRGIIVLNKIDLAENEWRELVIMDIKEEVKGTFLQSAPIVEVSAKTGEGIDKLKKLINDIVLNLEEEHINSPARLHIDRVFSVSGFGTVVTGTLIEGIIKLGDELTVYPNMLKTKVRGLQVHGESVEEAYKGQRVAINLANLKTTDISRGNTLAAVDSLKNTTLLDVRLDIVKGTNRIIENNSRLHLYHGSGETLCRLILFEEDGLMAGQSSYAQLVLQKPIAAKVGDRFVVRFYSPMETVGGGIILDNLPKKRSKKDEGLINMFRVKEKGSISERIACFILDKSKNFPSYKEIKRLVFSDSPLFDNELNQLIDSGEVILINNDIVIHKEYLKEIGLRCQRILEEFHANNPLLQGMKKDELKSKLFLDRSITEYSALLELLEKHGFIKNIGQCVAKADFTISISKSQQELMEKVEEKIKAAAFYPPTIEELIQSFSDKKDIKQIIDALIDNEVLIVLSSQIIVHKDIYNNAIELVRQLANEGEFSLAQFRDAINSSRKYALAFLEHFDNKGITKKQGENRIFIDKKD